MAVTDAQRRASAKYVRESVKSVNVRFYPTERDIWEHVAAKENKSGYIKDLIRKDMAREE